MSANRSGTPKCGRSIDKMKSARPPMWRFLGILGLFIMAMGIAVGIHDGNLTRGVGLAAALLVVLLPLVYLAIRFAERSEPDRMSHVIRTLVIIGVTLTCIAVIVGMVIHQKEKASNHTPDGIRQPVDGSPKPSA